MTTNWPEGGTRHCFAIGEIDSCFRLEGTDGLAGVEGRKERAGVSVHWPELTLRMTCSPNVGHFMVYSPVRAICVEPQTATVNAFQLSARGLPGTGTQVVRPGNPLVATSKWCWSGHQAANRHRPILVVMPGCVSCINQHAMPCGGVM